MLLFHFLTGRKVPAFLGSSFAFLGAYGLVTASGQEIPLTYSGFGVAVAGIVYLVSAVWLKSITREDCLLLPKGEKIAKLLHL